MDPATLALLARLLGRERTLALGTLRDGAPLVSMALFLPAPDLSTIHLHLSRLAWHTQDLQIDPRVSLCVTERDDGRDDPQTLARVSLVGEARAVSPADAAPLAQAWRARYPASQVALGLSDFAFYRVTPRGGRLVAGLGRIVTLAPGDLTSAAGARSPRG